MTLIEVRGPTDSSSDGGRHIANLRVSPDGAVELEAKSEGAVLERLRAAVASITSKPSLSVREGQKRTIDGEEVVVATRVDVAKADARYPWAVADELRKQFGYECVVREQGQG
jgi:hypothetical protein